MKKNKLLLIGWDAADWKIIGPLLAKGQMPSLQKMIQNGVYGNMSTMNPPYSPMLWSSVATGKTPDKHGVLGFIEVVPGEQKIRPVTTHSRKAKAIWNILHHKGYKSNLVGWWPSFPAEPIDGVVVTNKFQRVSSDPKKQKPIEPGTIHPESMVDELKDLRMFPWEITKEHFLPFMPDAAKIDQESTNNGLVPFSNILTQNVSLHNASTYLLRNTEWDFMGIYFDMIDHFCHGFMKYHPPKMAGVTQEKYDIYNDVVNSSYRFQDMMLGRVLELIDDDTTVMVMSDHGFESGSRRILQMPKVAAAPALDHRQFGIFVAMGPNIKKNEKIFGLGLIDVAPTILHHFDLPIGRDMDGKAILDIFKNPGTPKFIDSWETVKGDFAELPKEILNEALSDDETMEQLIELGYIERPDEDLATSIRKTKSELKHNEARVYLGKKDYHTAKGILIELLSEEDPIDITPFYIDLMTVSIGLEDYDEAEKYLNEYKKSKSEVNYNIYFVEADILKGKQQYKKALKVLEKALERRPNAEIYYRIGNLQLLLQNNKEAEASFEKAIDIEPDKAKFHKGIAEALFELKDYEGAAEHAFTSIELVKYYPGAHYVLGRALEKLGDLENAKVAFENAKRLQPKTFHRAEKAIENIEEKLTGKLNLSDKSSKAYRKNQITVVSGLPRSGTSVMMQMMEKGGMDLLVDGKREADLSNPKGYYEYEPVMSIHKNNDWLGNSQEKAVKIVAPLLGYLDPQYRYKIIFMKRDLDEVVKSQRVMTGKDPDTIPVKLYNAYRKQLESIETWKSNEPGVELIYVDYKDVLDDPRKMAKKVQEFIGKDLDIDAMESCVDTSLYRNRAKSATN
ncbi:alkaline phosphatase family protein [Rasiella sp. SM2506]|uniref:alkaline phosphatase family protein n=1 Tax=Rasiella sp. SM2506 TaxID=3423914 RepID=UPI003D798741